MYFLVGGGFVKISVIVPVYNSEKYLHRCLNSVVKQTYKNWEVIAIDDGSQDNSYSILLEYYNNDKRFKVYSQKNQGPGIARNNAIDYATGDYIVFLDSDDYIEPTYFEDLVKCVSENNSDVVFVDIIQEDPYGNVLKYELMSKYMNSTKDKILRHQMTGKLPWGAWRKAIRASLLKENNIKFSEDIVGEEALFSFKVVFNASKTSFLNKKYYHYVNYPNSQSKKGDVDPWGKVSKTISNYLKEIGMLEHYKKTLNSLAFTASIISIYRITSKYNFKDSLNQSKPI